MAGPHSRPTETADRPAGGPATSFTSADPSSTIDAPAPAAPPAGVPAIPRYKVGRCLGYGGMGVVYEAVGELGVKVALKVIHPDRLTPVLRARFLQEARAMMGLDHPHLARIYDFGEAAAGPYFTMRLLSDRTLAALFPGPGRDPAASLRAFLKVADAVAYLHARRLVHRDLKPSNVLLDDRGEPFVSDLGLVKELAGEPDVTDGLSPGGPTPAGGRSPTLTQTGAAVGTRAYMAPEQRAADGPRIGPPADVYALGLMAGEIAWGCRPAVDDTGALVLPGEGSVSSLPTGVKGMLREVLPSSDPPPPAQLPAPRPDLPAGLEAGLRPVLAKALAANPADRYPTAAEFRAALASVLEPVPAPVPEPTPTRRGVLMAGGVGALGLGAWATWAAMGLLKKKDPPPPPDPLAELQQAFLESDSVELLRDDGTWRWSELLGGASEWHTGPHPGGPVDARGWFDCPAGEVRLLEVARGLMGFGFRFVVDVANFGPVTESGAYVGRSIQPLTDRPVHALIAVGLREHGAPRTHWLLNGRTLSADRPDQFFQAPDIDERKQVLGDPGAWRALDLTLTAEMLTVVVAGHEFRDRRRKNGPVTRNVLLATGREFGRLRPEAAAVTPTFQPSEGLGLFGSGGPVAVRSARLVRVPDPTNP